jgi:hypothetical protein
MAAEAEELADGTLDPECACFAGVFSEALLAATDAVLDAFEGELAALCEAGDEEVFAVLERAVLGLNSVHRAHEAGFDTDEREQLCVYFDHSLTAQGIDVPALTARQGWGRHQLTDKWRKW